MNKVYLLGRCGNDPEAITFSNGNTMWKFSLATSESWKDKTTGERKEVSTWHNIETHFDPTKWGVKKGVEVFVEGQVTNRKYEDKDGNTKYSTGVKASTARAPNSRKESSGRPSNEEEIPF